jgi:hypothetical protein
MDDLLERTGMICGTVLIICLFAMFSSCTYYSAKDHNACVVASKTPEQAKNCERAR